MYIDCLWVSGSFKGHGYSTDLLDACIEDSKEKGRSGLCILSAAKKKQDFSKVEFLTVEEGLCVQCMHIGSYDDEPATVAMMHEFMELQG